MPLSLLDEPIIVVTQLGKLMSMRAEYELYRPDGTAIGSVTETSSAAGMFARKLATLEFVVADTSGQTVATIEKPGAFGRSTFLVTDAAGTQVGEIEQDNIMFAPQFTISTTEGGLRMTSTAAMAWDWDLVDDGGVSVGSVRREFTGLADVFTSEERFVVQLSKDLVGPRRLAAFASTICLDFVRDEKQRQRR